MNSSTSQIRQRFYQWRQRRPLKRTAAIIALAIAWPAAWFAKQLHRVSSRNGATRRILVIHFGGLGDTLLLTPALRALKESYPHARLDLITLHGHVADAFRDHPRIDSIAVLPPYAGQWIVSRFANLTTANLLVSVVRYYPELLLRLMFAPYDIAINFSAADFDRRVGNAFAYWSGSSVRVGAAASETKLVTHPVVIDQPNRHRVDTYFDFLKPLGITPSKGTYEYPVSPRDVRAAERLLRDRGIDRSRRMAVIHPGGKLHVNSRRWPAEYFARLCDFLFAEGFEIVLTGDREDVAVCEEVARAAHEQTVSVAGGLTFSESGALLSLAELVVTNDTATLHLAEAARVPHVVSIFGPTDPDLLAPRNDRHLIFRSSLPCAPCMGGAIDANTERCWRDVKEECLWQTKPEHVIAELRQLYGKRARVARA